MNRTLQILCASVGMFASSLLSDFWFGGNLESDDINQAFVVALAAGLIQLWLTRKKPQ